MKPEENPAVWKLEIRISKERKAKYVAKARKRGMKLLDWMLDACDKADEPNA